MPALEFILVDWMEERLSSALEQGGRAGGKIWVWLTVGVALEVLELLRGEFGL